MHALCGQSIGPSTSMQVCWKTFYYCIHILASYEWILCRLCRYNNSNVSNLSKYGKYKMMKCREEVVTSQWAKPTTRNIFIWLSYTSSLNIVWLLLMHISVAQASFGCGTVVKQQSMHIAACRNGTSLLCVYNVWLKFEDENPCPLGMLCSYETAWRFVFVCMWKVTRHIEMLTLRRNLDEL